MRTIAIGSGSNRHAVAWLGVAPGGPWVGPPAQLDPLVIYRGGNWELGRGWARLAVGGLAVKPITAQLMSTPTEP
jgi:hypothetical protein